jgi:hypothetical protein
MKFHFLFLLFFFSQTSFSQVTKIKIKKADALYKVSIAGADTGTASLKKIVIEQQLKVTNEKDGIKIFSYEAYIVDQTTHTAQMFSGKNKTLPDDLLEKLQEAYKQGPITLRFRKVLAYNHFNETIQLNDIEVKITK